MLKRLREERDFDAFPASRRTREPRPGGKPPEVRAGAGPSIRRSVPSRQDLLFAERTDEGELAGEGAVMITSANLTSGGLEHNLELGAVSYQPNMVGLTLDWFDELWNESAGVQG